MKTIKYFFMQTVDVIFLAITIFLLVMYVIEGWDVSAFLLPVAGYVFFNITNKAKMASEIDKMHESVYPFQSKTEK